MSHVPGHVDVPAQSFGVLLPKLDFNEATKQGVIEDFKKFINGLKLDPKAPAITVDEKYGAVRFPILFAPEDPNRKYNKGAPPFVGFHPYLIPWEDNDNRFLVMASDITDWPDHLSSEERLFKNVNKNKYLRSHHKEKKIEPLANPEDARTEEYFEIFDELLIESMGDADFPEKEKKVLKKTARYMKTSSFKTIYIDRNLKEIKVRNSNEVIKWLVENTIHLSVTGFNWNPGSLNFNRQN